MLRAAVARALCASSLSCQQRQLCASAAAAKPRQPASATMEPEVIDLVSPPAAPRRGRSRSRSVIDLVSPPALSCPDVLVISDDDDQPAAAAKVAPSPRRAKAARTSPPVAAPPPPPPPAPPAAHPPRTLAEAGRERDLRARGALPVGPDGEALCRWCKQPVVPPKRTFCSSACVEQHRLRSDPAFARNATFERDLGCCDGCGLSAHLLFCGAAAAASAPGSTMPFVRRSSARRWAPNTVLKSLLKAGAASAGAGPWRASVKGRAKTRSQLLSESLEAALTHAQRHSWPPAVLLAISNGAGAEELAAVDGYESGGESGAEGEAEGDAEAAEPLPASAAAAGAALQRWLSGNGFHTAMRAGKLSAGLFWQMDHRVPVAEGGGSCGMENLRTLCTPCHAVETARLAARRAGKGKAAKAVAKASDR